MKEDVTPTAVPGLTCCMFWFPIKAVLFHTLPFTAAAEASSLCLLFGVWLAPHSGASQGSAHRIHAQTVCLCLIVQGPDSSLSASLVRL